MSVLSGRPRAESPDDVAKNIQFLSGGMNAGKDHTFCHDPEVSHRVHQNVDTFITAAMALPLLGRSSGFSQKEKLLIAAYIWGVVDALSQLARISDIDTVAICASIIRKHLHTSPEITGALVPTVAQDPSLRPYVMLGGNAVLKFVRNIDRDAPLTLMEMLIDVQSKES